MVLITTGSKNTPVVEYVGSKPMSNKIVKAAELYAAQVDFKKICWRHNKYYYQSLTKYLLKNEDFNEVFQ